MPRIVNPNFTTYTQFGLTVTQWNALKSAITTALQGAPNVLYLPVAGVRALDPALANDALWFQIINEMNLQIV